MIIIDANPKFLVFIVNLYYQNNHNIENIILKPIIYKVSAEYMFA